MPERRHYYSLACDAKKSSKGVRVTLVDPFWGSDAFLRVTFMLFPLELLADLESMSYPVPVVLAVEDPPIDNNDSGSVVTLSTPAVIPEKLIDLLV